MSAVRFVALLIACLMVAGCAMPERLLRTQAIKGAEFIAPYDTQTYKQSTSTFAAIDLTPIILREHWVSRVDNVLVLWDEEGLAGPEIRGALPRDFGREVLRRFHRTMPRGAWRGALLTTASGPQATRSQAAGPYNPRLIESELDRGQRPLSIGGGTLASHIDRLTELALGMPGRTSVYLISRWERLDGPAIDAVARFHQRTAGTTRRSVRTGISTTWHGKEGRGGCFHAVGVGNAFAREKFLGRTACASSETFDAIAQPRDMAHFVSRTLFSGPADSDGDGIADFIDKCPATAQDRIVDAQGCLRFPDLK